MNDTYALWEEIDFLRKAMRDLIQQIELHTDCKDGRIKRESLDAQIKAAEQLVGVWPEFKTNRIGRNTIVDAIFAAFDEIMPGLGKKS